MDVFWFRLPKTAAPDNETMGVFEAGRLFVLIDRRDYWQCAFVFPKGRAEEIRDEGIDAFRKRVAAVGPETAAGADRSEEHTSELQSLMRISYAVFCLKKKKHKILRHMSYTNV